jgi:hypothetical protein
LARATGFIRRVRAFDGRTFLQTLVFGWLRRPNAPLEHLAQGLGISRQALDQRFTPQAAAFCKQALLQAVQELISARPLRHGLLRFFQGVYVDDCTQLQLPDAAAAAFPGGCRSTDGSLFARMKVLLRWELQGGALCHLSIHSGRTGDTTALADAPPLPRGCLHLADLGFLAFARLYAEALAGVYWLTRLPAQTRLFLTEPTSRRRRQAGADSVPLWRQLRRWRRQGQKTVDVAARVGDKDAVGGRLVALACPPQVVTRRRTRLHKDAKHRGRVVSERQKEFCHWTVLFTNIPVGWLSAEDLWELYRLRWQIELLIKRFKSAGGLRDCASACAARVEVEWYVRLLGQVVRNWLQLLSGGPLRDVNAQLVGDVIKEWLGVVRRALGRGVRELAEVLYELWQDLGRLRERTRRQQQPTAAQRLQERARGSPGAGDRPEKGTARPEGEPTNTPSPILENALC